MKPSGQRQSEARRQHIEAIVARHVRPSSSPRDLFDRRPGCGPLMAADGAPPVAAHIVVSRTLYAYHGIYVGDGKVVHYRGLSRSLRAGPVEEVSLAEFARGRPIRVRLQGGARFDRAVVIARAQSRLGEDCYRILSNNCEHFCEWCVHGRNRSLQIEEWRARPRRALLAALRFLMPGGAPTARA